MSNSMEESLVLLASESKDLFVPNKVKSLSSAPSPLSFLRSYVMANVPVVITNGCSHWPAVNKWTDEYLINCLGHKKVSVALTPNGYADAPNGEYFVLPHEEKMTFSQFLQHLRKKSGDVPYLQKQNSSFTEEFMELIPDAELEIPWASEAFDKKPDAINFWMGDERSLTSMHKDHYENLYAVVRGRKTFILQPPTDLGCIPYEEYIVGRYFKNTKGMYSIMEERDEQHCENCAKEFDDTTRYGDDGFAEMTDRLQHVVCISNIQNGNHVCCHKRQALLSQQESEAVVSQKETDACDVFCSCVCHNPKRLPWISINPLQPDLTKYPLYKHTTQLTVTLNAGDLLYLPSLWFHHVQQTSDTIAVNFWYDMEYDIKYSYYKFVENIKDRTI